jgi:hypothetical protein
MRAEERLALVDSGRAAWNILGLRWFIAAAAFRLFDDEIAASSHTMPDRGRA